MKVYLRSAFSVTVAVVIAMCAYFVLTFASLWHAGNFDNGEVADVIVVMGAAQYDGRPSPLLEARLQHAWDLWSTQKRAPLIALTGGKREGDRYTESEAGQMWLLEKGVPQSAIVMETVGESTWQSLEALAPVLRDSQVVSAIMVSSDWHVGRAASTLEDLGFDVTASAANVSSRMWKLREWARETIGVGIGRIIGFDTLFSFTG